MSIFIYLLLLIFLLASSITSAMETAFFSISHYKVLNYRYDKDPSKRRIYYLLQNPKQLLVTIIMLNIICNVLIQNFISNLFGNFGWVLKVGLPLALTLFIGEIIPKSLALPNNVLISRRLSKFILVIQKLLSPFRIFLTWITNYVSRFLFFFLKNEKPLSLEELELILETSKEKGILQSEEKKFIKGYLDLKKATVKEKMRPKDEIIYYSFERDLSYLFHLMKEKKYSKIPITSENLDSIEGVLSLEDYFNHFKFIDEKEDLLKYLTKPFYVPETMNALSLLNEMRQKDEDMAFVVDEYGQVLGLIVQEDLIETVIGEVNDLKNQMKKYTQSGENVIIASGKLGLDEFEEIFHKKLEAEGNIATIGGWIIERLGDIPVVGDTYTTDDFFFYILAADPNRIKRMYIRHLKPSRKK